MASMVQGVFKAIREKGIGNFVKQLREEGYTKRLLDGNLFFHQPLYTTNFKKAILDKNPIWSSTRKKSFTDFLLSRFSTTKWSLITYANSKAGCNDHIEILKRFIILANKTSQHRCNRATLVEVDKFGNKYYEKLQDTQHGWHRWVEYAQKGRYNASQVPPEWHGWLHHITDHTGDELLMLKPKRYGVEHKENFSGEGDEYIYHSKGHALNPGQRNWTRYQPWQPTKI